MSEPREFKVGDVISMDDLIIIEQDYFKKSVVAEDDVGNKCIARKHYNKLRKATKFKIVALPEVD